MTLSVVSLMLYEVLLRYVIGWDCAPADGDACFQLYGVYQQLVARHDLDRRRTAALAMPRLQGRVTLGPTLLATPARRNSLHLQHCSRCRCAISHQLEGELQAVRYNHQQL